LRIRVNAHVDGAVKGFASRASGEVEAFAR